MPKDNPAGYLVGELRALRQTKAASSAERAFRKEVGANVSPAELKKLKAARKKQKGKK